MSDPNNVKSNASTPLLSLVVPCFNEEEVILQTHGRLVTLAKDLEQGWQTRSPNPHLEIIYVDDGSRDRTLSRLHGFCSDPATSHVVRVVSFSRNFGHQAAIAAGLLHSQGHWVATIDADLQDPPELILKMLDLATQQGADVVHGRRQSREGETIFKKATAFLFYRLLNILSRGRALNDVGDFRLMSRRVVRALNDLPERSLYVRGLLPEIGFPQAILPYERPPRAAGETKYTLSKMMALAFEGITAVSVAPLKFGLALGLFTAIACVLYLVSIMIRLVLDPTFAVRGWPSLMAVILFLGAVQLLSVGILGEYIGQIHREVKHRPRFFVDVQKSRL
jgi:dolichol-phosphate mannosyltransferase